MAPQIWISPVVKQLNGTANGAAYHGYWPQDLYSLNDNFGSPADLSMLSSALHNRSMYLMVDITPNNMAYEGDVNQIDYSKFNPTNQQGYFHAPCSVDYSNQTSIEGCSMSLTANALPDHATDNSVVSGMLTSWVQSLVANYSIDGLRLDAADHMDTNFLTRLQDTAGVFIIGEVDNGDPTYTCSRYQGPINAVLDYPMYFPLVRAFNTTGGNMANLVDMIAKVRASCSDTSLLGAFTENHDQPRFASFTSDMALTQNVLTFNFLSDNIPILYYGQEQHYAGGLTPADREALWLSNYTADAPLYQFVSHLNTIRSRIALQADTSFLTTQQQVIYNDTSVIALHKGLVGQQMVVVLNNQGSGGGQYTLTVPNSGLSGGQSITELIGCTAQSVNNDGSINVAMGSGAPKVFYATNALTNTSLCGH